jgi:hypothetical protein
MSGRLAQATRRRLAAVVAAVALAACSSNGSSDSTPGGEGSAPGAGAADPTAAPPTASSAPTTTPTTAPQPADIEVRIDAAAPGPEISPLIRGVSGDLNEGEMREAGIALNSWGGNPATRYNYEVGHLWNAASDWEFRNTDYGQDGDSFERFATMTDAAGAELRLAVPTLGWIAKDSTSCSFPEGDGCAADSDWNCEDPGPLADPETTSVRSTPEMVAAWMTELDAAGLAPRFVALDNEPELWGHTHYDVHPECPTYEEILERYLEHATAIRAVAPDAELTGPVMCCWYDYWDIAPGPADGSGTDFLTWFLTQVHDHDVAAGVRTLDVVDVHFYPQTEVFNDDTDPETAARRLRSARALWDPGYDDESWIGEPIEFIPRMRRTIEASYPGLPLMISEWNFGADASMNGALTIADVLGVYGREDVYAAAYWRSPEPDSPGYFAFKMHGNYDDAGSAFEGATLEATSSEEVRVGAYAALGPDGVLRVMLLNKDPRGEHRVDLQVAGFAAATEAERWTYGAEDPSSIETTVQDVTGPIRLPAESITVLELAAS